jgi:hypothetical protein
MEEDSYRHVFWDNSHQGYYFWDEADMLIGWWDTKDEAALAYEEYCYSLDNTGR